jgi:ribose transport system substrate-binding protein
MSRFTRLRTLFSQPPRHKVLAVIGAGAMAVSMAACSDAPTSGGSGGGGDDTVRLGLSVPALDTPFFSALIDGATQAAEDTGGEVVQTANAGRDSGQQVTDFRNLITAGANTIMAGVVDREAIQPALDYAASQNVPVVIVDDQPAAGEVFAVVKADNYGMGASAAQQLGGLLPDGGTVLSISGGLETSNGRDRANGFADEMAESFPDIEIIDQTADWDGPTSGNVMSTVLSSTPDIAGVNLATDTLYWDPVAAALEGRGRLVPAGQPGHVAAVAIDGGTSALEAIRNGFLDATISQPVDQYALRGVQYLQMALEGETLEAGPTDHGSEIVEQDGYLIDQLPAPVITRDNADDSTLWGNAS